MSHTLIITERKKGLTLKNPLAENLARRFGDEVNDDGLEYLRGLFAGISDDKEAKIIAKIIDRLEAGAVFDIRSEY